MKTLIEFNDGYDRIELIDNGVILSLNHIADTTDLISTEVFQRTEFAKARKQFFATLNRLESSFVDA